MNLIALVSLCFAGLVALLIGHEEYVAKPIERERFKMMFLLAHQNTKPQTTYRTKKCR